MTSHHDMLEVLVGVKEPAVLATVVKVEGSAYRGVGTMMVCTKSGQVFGVISAGCLEEDLGLRAQALLAGESYSEIVVYDMRAEDDLGWGRGAGCNGKVHVLLEVVVDSLHADVVKLREKLSAGQAVELVKDLATVPGVVASDYVPTKRVEEGYFHYIFQPKPRLFIFGAGIDVRPVAELADKVGFSVTVWDWRKGNVATGIFPRAKILQGNNPVIDAALTEQDYVIVMTHDFEEDEGILHTLLQDKRPHYLGVLGPKRRTSRLLGAPNVPDWIHSPIGLAIGAEGPEEIAVSIVAELIQVLRGGS